MTNWLGLVLKGDSMVQNPMGLYRMHPYRSFLLGLSANGWMSQDQVFCTFFEQMLGSVYCTFSFNHRWNTELPLWQYSLLDKVYFLVNFHNSHTRVVYWGNKRKYTPSWAGPLLAFPVLAQLYWEYIFPYWPSCRLWCGSFGNSPQGGLLMSTLNFLSTRFYETWLGISLSARV